MTNFKIRFEWQEKQRIKMIQKCAKRRCIEQIKGKML